MPIDTQDSGFLSRWSRRKELARQGVELAEASPPAKLPVAPAVEIEEQHLSAPPAHLPIPESPSAAEPQAPPPPTLADVALLDRDSDFTRFVSRGVQPEVKNAALAKLFADPHFNVMDRLDVYIDDYSAPDPIPAGMLRQMLQAHVLGLFDDEKKPDQAADSNDPVAPPGLLPSQQPSCEAAPPTPPAAHENLDLQLQPDDGAGHCGPAAGAGQDARGSH